MTRLHPAPILYRLLFLLLLAILAEDELPALLAAIDGHHGTKH